MHITLLLIIIFKVLPKGAMATNRKWGIEELEARKHHKGVIAMLTLDLMPFTFVSNAGFLYYSAIGSPRYDVCSETFYRGLVDKVKESLVKTSIIRYCTCTPLVLLYVMVLCPSA